MIIVITGAAGRIAYAFIPLLLNGSVFGTNTKIDLRLLDIPMAQEKLAGVLMELQDCNYELLSSVVATTDPTKAFKDVELAVLLGGFPRKQGMERKDLIHKNAEVCDRVVNFRGPLLYVMTAPCSIL